MSLIKFILRLFIINLIIFYSLNSYSEDGINYKKFYLDKLRENTKTEIELDLLFSEYCFFNDHDPICYDDISKDNNEINNESDNELENLENIKGEIYYTIANVNMREGPSTSSKILKIILKDQVVEVLKVSRNNSDWLIIKYKNSYGYIYGDLISKNMQTSANNSTPIEKQKEQTDDEWLEEQVKICVDDLKKDSFNNKIVNTQYCSCFYGSFDEIITDEDLEYLDEYEKPSDELELKLENHRLNCVKKTGLKTELNEEEYEYIAGLIDDCTKAYDSNIGLNRKQHNEWCTCFFSQWTNLITDEDFDYYEKYNEKSKNQINKEEELASACFKDIE